MKVCGSAATPVCTTGQRDGFHATVERFESWLYIHYDNRAISTLWQIIGNRTRIRVRTKMQSCNVRTIYSVQRIIFVKIQKCAMRCSAAVRMCRCRQTDRQTNNGTVTSIPISEIASLCRRAKNAKMYSLQCSVTYSTAECSLYKKAELRFSTQ